MFLLLLQVAHFATAVCLWAGICCGLYWGLRLLEGLKWIGFLVRWLGVAALVGWNGVYGLVILFAGETFDWDGSTPRPPYPLWPVIGIGLGLSLALIVISSLVKYATNLSWRRSVLFGALYFPLAHGISALVLLPTGIGDAISRQWDYFDSLARHTVDHTGFWFGLFSGALIILFPLGVPLTEICVRNFHKIAAAYVSRYAPLLP